MPRKRRCRKRRCKTKTGSASRSAGRKANGQIKRGYRLTCGGKVVRARSQRQFLQLSIANRTKPAAWTIPDTPMMLVGTERCVRRFRVSAGFSLRVDVKHRAKACADRLRTFDQAKNNCVLICAVLRPQPDSVMTTRRKKGRKSLHNRIR